MCPVKIRYTPVMAKRRRDQSHLVVISMDGLSELERGAIASLPAFSRLLSRGTRIGSLDGVYPTLTYVLHATMMTGCHPENHGIDHNHPLQPWVPGEYQRWYWYARELKRPSLFDVARQAGLSTAAVLWPLVSGASIQWNLPEIAALPGENQILKALKAGSPAFLLDLQARFGRYRRARSSPFWMILCPVQQPELPACWTAGRLIRRCALQPCIVA